MTQDAIYAACYRWMRRAWLEGADTGEDPEILQAIEAVYSEEEMDAAVIAELQKPENADLLSAALSEPQPKHIPTPEDINAQDWAGMDGATAYQLIERHGEDWSHIGRLMAAWLAANATQAPAPEPEALPHPGSPEASAMIDSVLAEYDWPANAKNAARAGYVAARRLMGWARKPLPDFQAPAVVAVTWTDAAILSLLRSNGDGPFGEEDITTTRRFMERAEEIRAELVASQPPVQPTGGANG